MVAEGQGRRPGPKARAEGVRRRRLRKFWPFWTSLTHFRQGRILYPAGAFGALPRRAPSAHCPGGRLRRTAPAGAFGALPRRAPSAHCPGGRLRRMPRRAPLAHFPGGRLPRRAPSAHCPHTPTVQARQAARNVGGGGSNPEPHAFFFTHL